MKPIVISLGGSIVVPDKIDYNFLRKFRALILKHVKKGKRFILICGGGATAREYQKAASKVFKLSSEDLDWIGIHSTRLNAHLMRTIFEDISHKKIIRNPKEEIKFKEKILIAAGWKPGCSTDYDAVLLARNFKSHSVINLSNIRKAYTKDPKKYKTAKPLDKVNWKDFRKIVGDKWVPGANFPFDPVASKLAEKLGLKIAIMKGTNLKNLDNYLNKKKFIGTIIE